MLKMSASLPRLRHTIWKADGKTRSVCVSRRNGKTMSKRISLKDYAKGVYIKQIKDKIKRI
mgnify:CR=1 FL=1